MITIVTKVAVLTGGVIIGKTISIIPINLANIKEIYKDENNTVLEYVNGSKTILLMNFEEFVSYTINTIQYSVTDINYFNEQCPNISLKY